MCKVLNRCVGHFGWKASSDCGGPSAAREKHVPIKTPRIIKRRLKIADGDKEGRVKGHSFPVEELCFDPEIRRWATAFLWVTLHRGPFSPVVVV